MNETLGDRAHWQEMEWSEPRQGPRWKRLRKRLEAAGFSCASELAARLPEKALVGFAEPKLRRGIAWKDGVDFLLDVILLMRRSWSELSPSVRQRFTQNIFLNALLGSREKHRRASDVLGDYPCVMVVSPTMRCNLRCAGCYSFNYSKQDAISTERLHQLYSEAEELGIHLVVLTGGEPFLRRDTLDLCEAHPNLLFMTYTNGTIIAKRKLGRRLADLGNVVPCVSVEGFEQETDARRGRGTHRRILAAMRDMSENGVLFGYSATPMRHNNELLCSDAFVDFYRKQGCRVGWYFSYMPVGRDPSLDMMPTPAQRLFRFHRIRSIRREHKLLAADFWCDGALVGGCLSGGRTFFHVNAQGGVEPCVFHQFHVDNINDKTLLDCLNSSYFRDIRNRLREIENPLRPCPVIDNPWMLRELVAKHRPLASQPTSREILRPDIAEGLDCYAEALKQVLDPVFADCRQGCPWPLEPSGGARNKEAARTLTHQ